MCGRRSASRRLPAPLGAGRAGRGRSGRGAARRPVCQHPAWDAFWATGLHAARPSSHLRPCPGVSGLRGVRQERSTARRQPGPSEPEWPGRAGARRGEAARPPDVTFTCENRSRGPQQTPELDYTKHRSTDKPLAD